jgi:hypothetical protein
MVNDDSQDAYLTSLLAPARAYVERVTRYLFVSGSRTELFRAWGDYLEIWRQPITSIDSISYSTTADPDDDAAYTGFIANLGFPARIGPAPSDSFPDLIAGGTITVGYTAGALDPTDEVYLIGKRAMLLIIGDWFDNRENFVIGTISSGIQFALDRLLEELRPVSVY